MDLQEKRQLELSGQVAWVRARARPWRSIIALVLAVAAAVVSVWFRGRFGGWHSLDSVTAKAVTAGAAAGFCVFGMTATLGLSRKARDRLRPLTGSAHAAVVRYLSLIHI